METARHCAYNVTRNVLLSERVWCASESLDQSELLELVMNGPGLDRHAGVWIRRTPGWIDLPRPFALDFVYVDEQHNIVELGGVNLSAGFPPVGEHVAGALILANRRLSEAGVHAGDQVRICGQGELAALVKATSPSAIEAAAARTPSAAGQVSASTTFIPFQVSRYSEFVFEPFAGSLVYLPSVEAPAPQTSEFFLPERAKATEQEPAGEELEEAVREETGPPAIEPAPRSVPKARKRPKQASRKPRESEEEPHFYTPKPIRFFDPAAAATSQPESKDASETKEAPVREPTQLSPELKAAILQIDEQLRREKEGLGPEKKKGRKRKPAKKEAETVEQEPVEAAHAGWEELAEPLRPSEAMITAEADAAEKILEEAETAAEATLELRPETAPAPQIELVPEPLAEPPVDESGAEDEAVSFSELVCPVQENPVQVEASAADPAAYEAVSPVEETLSPEEAAPPESVSAAEEVPFPAEVEDAESASVAEEISSAQEVIPLTPAEAEVVAFASPIDTEPAEVSPIRKAPPTVPIESAPPVHSPAEEPKPAEAKPSLGKRLQRWIGREIGDKRRGERAVVPGLVAFYWSGGAPRPHEVVNISKSGFYLRTKELWLPDTLVRMTLQRSEEVRGSSKESIRVLARVVRIDDGGVGHEFVTSDALRHVRSRDVLPADGTDPKELEKFLRAGNEGIRERGSRR